MLKLNISFNFRIKGSHYYSAELLTENQILETNQSLKTIPEPQNLVDANALQIWIPKSCLSKQAQTKLALSNIQQPLSLNYYQQTLRLLTKLSTPCSTVRSKMPNWRYSKLQWHYLPEKWLLGYVPKDLAALLANPIQNCNIECSLTHLESTPVRLYADLTIRISMLKGLHLLWKLLTRKTQRDYTWKLIIDNDYFLKRV